MVKVALFISATLALLWIIESEFGSSLESFWRKGAEVAVILLLYWLLLRFTSWRKTNRRQVSQEDLQSVSTILVAYASQTGVAEELARHTAKVLENGGCKVHLVAFSALDISFLEKTQTALFVASTTGEGDAPATAASFFQHEMAAPANLSHLNYAVLALGDKTYHDFCAFGRRLDNWLKWSGGMLLFDRIDVDRGKQGAVDAWNEQLSGLGAVVEKSRSPVFETWYLNERRLLNPGSENPPVYHVILSPAGAIAKWQAGDIAVVAPRNSPLAIEALLLALSLDGNAIVWFQNNKMRLLEAIGRCSLPHYEVYDTYKGGTAQFLVDSLPVLTPREYSLASLPGNGKAELVIRQMRHADGQLGVGSGWLTEYAPEKSQIEMRLRRNSSFHGQGEDRPMIMIGAGSGIAGLRAHMKERIIAGHHRNWLIFGERDEATDYLFRDEIEKWHASSVLDRLDLCFLENGQQKLVQDVLGRESRELKSWLKADAAIYVSGSRRHIGAGVEGVLKNVLGTEGFSALRRDGKYKADVY